MGVVVVVKLEVLGKCLEQLVLDAFADGLKLPCFYVFCFVLFHVSLISNKQKKESVNNRRIKALTSAFIRNAGVKFAPVHVRVGIPQDIPTLTLRSVTLALVVERGEQVVRRWQLSVATHEVTIAQVFHARLVLVAQLEQLLLVVAELFVAHLLLHVIVVELPLANRHREACKSNKRKRKLLNIYFSESLYQTNIV